MTTFPDRIIYVSRGLWCEADSAEKMWATQWGCNYPKPGFKIRYNPESGFTIELITEPGSYGAEFNDLALAFGIWTGVPNYMYTPAEAVNGITNNNGDTIGS